MILEESSDSGDGEQLSLPALLTALQPDRFSGILSGAHFRVWKTPPFPLDGIPILLARMLLQDLSNHRPDFRTRSESIYTTLRSISMTSQDGHPRIIPAFTHTVPAGGPFAALPETDTRSPRHQVSLTSLVSIHTGAVTQ